MASIYGAVSATGWQLRLDYSVSQETEKNRSLLSLTLYVYDGTGLSYNQDSQSCRYVLQGSSVWHPYRYEKKGWYRLGSDSCTVAHRADGSGSVTLSAAWYSGFESQWTPESLSLSKTVTLPTIPRASQVQGQAMTLGKAGTITLQRASDSFTHSIRYQIGESSGTICEKSGENRVSWTPPLSLAREMPNAVSGSCVLTATTWSGSREIGSDSCTVRLYVPEDMKPSASLETTVRNDNDTVAGWGVCLKGWSKLSYQVTAAGVRGSSIRSCRVEFAGQSAQGLSGSIGPVGRSGSLTPKVQVTDSRGRKTTVSGSAVKVLPYGSPTLTLRTLSRCNAEGTLQDDGTCVKLRCKGSCSLAGGHNSVKLRYRLRPVGGSYGDYVSLGNDEERILQGLEKMQSYELELSAIDALGSVRTMLCAVPTAAVTLHLAEGGQAVGVGKYAERTKTLELAPDWELWLHGKTLLDVVWPVGSLYLSMQATDPGELFGGQWQRIRDRFLLAAGDSYAAGESGGQATHTLTTEELPAHRHGWKGYIRSGSCANDYKMAIFGTDTVDLSDGDGPQSAGGGKAHNNMPPYLAVYIWRRTA